MRWAQPQIYEPQRGPKLCYCFNVMFNLQTLLRIVKLRQKILFIFNNLPVWIQILLTFWCTILRTYILEHWLLINAPNVNNKPNNRTVQFVLRYLNDKRLKIFLYYKVSFPYCCLLLYDSRCILHFDLPPFINFHFQITGHVTRTTFWANDRRRCNVQTPHSGYVTLCYFNHCHHTKSRDDSQTMWQKQSEHIGQWGGIGRVVPIVKC